MMQMFAKRLVGWSSVASQRPPNESTIVEELASGHGAPPRRRWRSAIPEDGRFPAIGLALVSGAGEPKIYLGALTEEVRTPLGWHAAFPPGVMTDRKWSCWRFPHS